MNYDNNSNILEELIKLAKELNDGCSFLINFINFPIYLQILYLMLFIVIILSKILIK